MALQFREETDGKWSDWMIVPVVPHTQEELDDAMRQVEEKLEVFK
jgi:hypothetical protein